MKLFAVFAGKVLHKALIRVMDSFIYDTLCLYNSHRARLLSHSHLIQHGKRKVNLWHQGRNALIYVYVTFSVIINSSISGVLQCNYQSPDFDDLKIL